MLRLTQTQRHYLLFNQLLPAILINFLINFVFGWLFFHTVPLVSLLQPFSAGILPSSIAMDLLPTTFFLILFTNLIVSHQVFRRLREGRVESLVSGALLRKLGQPRALATSVRLAVVITLTLVPITVLVFHWNDIDALSLWRFVCFKAIYAALLAALFTPLVVIRALREGTD